MVTGNGYVANGLSVRGLVWAFTYQDSGVPLVHRGAQNLWHPLTWVSHMADAEIFGLQHPGGHHLTNLLLHIATAWLVCLFVGRLTFSSVAGLVAALFFAIHPLRVESVAWVSERKDVLSGLFFFGSLFLILRGNRRAAFVAFLAAMMGKPSTVVLPVVAILALGWRDGERAWGLKFWWDRVVAWRWWFAAAVVVSLMALWFQGRGSHAPAMESLPPGYRMLHLAYGLLFTVWHGVVPANLTFHYAYPEYSVGLALGVWGIFLGAAIVVWLGRGRYPGVFFAMAWFLICALPSSGVFYVGTSLTADRYTYLSFTGAFAMLGLWVAGRERISAGRVALAGVAVLVWAVVSYRQCATWRDGWTLFSHAEAVQPKNPVVLVNLGGMHQQAGSHEEALGLFRRTLEIAPANSHAWFNLGNSLRDTGKADEAILAFRQAVKFQPQYANAWRNLGLMLAAEGSPDRNPREARDAFERASELTGYQDPVPLLLQAEMEFELGNIPATKSLLEKLHALNPSDSRIDLRRNALRRKLPY